MSLKNETRAAIEKAEADKAEANAETERKTEPLWDNVLVRLEEKDKMQGAIIIPDSAGGSKCEAMVIKVGPGRMDEHGEYIPVKIPVGMRVLLSAWGGHGVDVKDDKYKLIKETDILAAINE